MVQFDQPTPLGIPLYAHEAAAAAAELVRADRVACVNEQAVGRMVDEFLRDEGLRSASGRWVPGQLDPAWFVPGDVAAIRATAMGGDFWNTLFVATNQHGEPQALVVDGQRLLDDPVATSVLVEATSASPCFLPPGATRALLSSHPPSPTIVDDLRLPAARVMVVFGADVRVDPAAHPWPRDFPARQQAATGLVSGMITRGGYLSGVVLLADAAGRLRDDCIWVLAAAPNPSLPSPHSLDRLRGLRRGWRSMAGWPRWSRRRCGGRQRRLARPADPAGPAAGRWSHQRLAAACPTRRLPPPTDRREPRRGPGAGPGGNRSSSGRPPRRWRTGLGRGRLARRLLLPRGRPRRPPPRRPPVRSAARPALGRVGACRGRRRHRRGRAPGHRGTAARPGRPSAWVNRPGAPGPFRDRGATTATARLAGTAHARRGGPASPRRRARHRPAIGRCSATRPRTVPDPTTARVGRASGCARQRLTGRSLPVGPHPAPATTRGTRGTRRWWVSSPAPGPGRRCPRPSPGRRPASSSRRVPAGGPAAPLGVWGRRPGGPAPGPDR